MKHKRAAAVLLAGAAVLAVQPASAEESEANPAESLDPLEYESLKFKKKTEYLHDRGQVEMKNTLTEAQINLDFSEEIRFPPPIEVADLFQDAGRPETGTAAGKASELGLFTEEAPVKEASAEREPAEKLPVEEEGGTARTWIFIGIIAAAVIGLFAFMLPALLKSGGAEAPKKRRKEETEGKLA